MGKTLSHKFVEWQPLILVELAYSYNEWGCSHFFQFVIVFYSY